MPRSKTSPSSKSTNSKSKTNSRATGSKSHGKGTDKRWVKKVKTVSTFPPQGTFTKGPQEIAETLADKKVSPKGIGSGIRMVQYFINRGGKGLSATRRKKLERAKEILHEKLEAQKKKKREKKSPAASKNDRQ
ncbi:MAG TPA: DUF3175 domain-containing protein [Pirellulales bacterium]|jgi:tRNA(adenine34) deaminase|nr:DUF3175 domain-containing protein [Pirellulales bacterium]